MNQDYIQPNEWSIIEEGFDPSRVRSSESLFSIGNGAMGQRANFEEHYSGSTFQGSLLLECIIQIKQEWAGGKMDIPNISQKY